VVSDHSFSKSFMITFKSFMSLDELFELLVQRFWIEPPANLAPEELEDWTKQKQVMIRLRYVNSRIHIIIYSHSSNRVLNTFRTMLTDDDVLEKEDMYILDRMRDFCVQAQVTSSVAAAKQLVVLIDRVVGRSHLPCISLGLPLEIAPRGRSYQDDKHGCSFSSTAYPAKEREEDQVARSRSIGAGEATISH
jgi:hypothetical protein